ncbi:MAG: methylmalonyl-CoA mutase subunit beta [Bacteroidales bacterium]|nr:methylmalonyl-CoA mutase subunit beta [Bacteroidales bacterium]
MFFEFTPVSKEQWKEAITAELKGSDYDKKMRWQLYDGVILEPFYMSEDVEKYLLDDIPGVQTFQRGYKEKENSWKIIQQIETLDIQQANAFALHALQRGADGISFRIDYINEVEWLALLLKDIDFTDNLLYVHSFYSYSLLIDLLKRVCDLRKIDSTEVKGGFNFDPLSYFLLHGQYYNSLDDNKNELKFLMQESKKNFPYLKIVQVNGQYFANAGASAIQELAFTLSLAHEYLVILQDLGLDISDIIPKMRITMSVGSSYFQEIAKFRAARRLWTVIVSAYSEKKELQKISWHAVSSLYNKTYYDLYNNMLRNTVEAMAAVIGGIDELTILPHDFLLGQETEFGHRIARNTQLILREEARLDQIIDPAAGSYYIETMTDVIVEEAWKLFNQIEDLGGFIKAMESGFLRNEIDKIHQARSKDIISRKFSYVGINNYPNLKENLENVKLHYEKISSKNAVSSPALELRRGAEPYEKLRMKTDWYVTQGKKRPLVLLLQFGNLTMRNARAVFSTNFFGIAGFTVDELIVENEDHTLVEQIQAKSPDLVVLCSSDEEYLTTGVKLAQLLSSLSHLHIVLAGNPGENEALLRQAGIQSFIHIRTNALQALTEYQNMLFGL